MPLNLINTTGDNVRLKLVPREGATITLGEGNENPTAFIDTDGSLIGCFGKKVFHCVPLGLSDDIVDQAGYQYYDDYPNLSTKWALTSTAEFPDGTSETVTFRWVREEWDYSDSPMRKAVSSRVVVDAGGGRMAHFQVYSGSWTPAGSAGDDPQDWVIIRWHATPDLAEGELDYYTTLLQPLAGEEYIEVISCGMEQFPGL